MLIKNDEELYGALSKGFHWTIALIIIGLIALGWYMAELDREAPGRAVLYLTHKSLGVLVLELALLRLLWISYTRPPSLPAGLRQWEKTAAHLMHIVLYGMMFAIPFTGYMLSATGGYPVTFFNLYEIPAIFPKDEGLHEIAEEVHEILAFTTLGLVVVHVAGALKHRFVDGNDVLERML